MSLSIVGETVAARLIQKAGSLTSLAKCPASTVQILGKIHGTCIPKIYFALSLCHR
jgi:hypothetical protein